MARAEPLSSSGSEPSASFESNTRPLQPSAPFEAAGTPNAVPKPSPPSDPAPVQALLIDEHEGSREQEGSSPIEPVVPAEASIAIRDARSEEGPAAWIGSIGRRLERHAEDGLPFAVLLIEVPDIDRLAQAESAEELTRLIVSVERALSEELRPADVLTRETRGRYWLVSPETDGSGARTLAERLARTVRLSASHRGVGLEVAIGVAVCPQDGGEAARLAAHADVGVYAARAAGQSIAPADGAG
jgi:GGDEF domain-containing protein